MNFFARFFGRKKEAISNPAEVPELFKLLSPLFDQIGAEVIACIPQNWTNAVLTINCDGRQINYSLKNHRNEAGQAAISLHLAKLTEQLYGLMASNGQRWTKAELSYDHTLDSWKFKSNFSYADSPTV